MIALITIAWLVVVFGAFAAGRLRGLREALEIIVEEQEASDGRSPHMFIKLPARVANRILEKSRRWAPWALWR